MMMRSDLRSPVIALPHRVAFLAPRLGLPDGAADLEQSAALLLFLALFEHLVRHPSVTLTDPDDGGVADRDGRLLNVDHPSIDSIRREQFGEGKRDELLWFEISLDPVHPAPVKLCAERYDGARCAFEAAGASLSDGIAGCLSQWLASIQRPVAPRPLEAFDVGDLLEAARRGVSILQGRGQRPTIELDPPPRLVIPYLRFVGTTCNIYVHEPILAIEADNPWATRDRFLDGIHDDARRSRDPIRAAIAAAPMFGKLYLSMFGEGVSQEEQLRAFAMAAVLIPGNAYSLVDYGYALDRAERWAEALRYGERATERAPYMLRAHLLGLEVVDLCRYGRALVDSNRALGWLEHLAEEGVVNAGDPDYLHCKLRHSSHLMRAGRLEEAIAERANLLDGLESSWTQQTKVLHQWQSDPATFAQLYAREASLRGDPGRVVEGFSAAPPDSASELAMFVEALLALGDDGVALMAYGHRLRTRFIQNPIARLAGAKAFLANGELAGAIDCILGSALRFPTAEWDTAHDRLLRAAASAPIAAWERVIDGHLAVGAKRLAKLVARDAADFVPGVPSTSSIAKALGPSTPIAFGAHVFAELRAAFAAHDLADVEPWFDSFGDATLAAADHLATAWTSLIPPMPSGRSRDEHLPRAAKLLFVFAGAFGRYLAASTQAPNVLAGGYRQIASGALEMLKGVRGLFGPPVLRHLFEGIERLAPNVDAWLLDGWLLRVERALDLEASIGHLAALAAGLPIVQSLVRGDEQVGYELHLAHASTGRAALDLFERSVRAIGRGPVPKWSETAVAVLAPEDRLDIHHTASFIANNFAGPAVEAAKILLAKGDGAAAFERLATSFANGSKPWRDKQLAQLGPLWNAAKMPCPIDFQSCFDAGIKAFQQGNMQLAFDAHRWLVALDPDNAQAWKNLGMASGYLGKATECIAAFARASMVEAPKWAGQLLRQAGHHQAATRAYRYASHWFTTGEEWSYLAVAAYVATDYETAASAFERAFELAPALATAANLNMLCDALHETRSHARALRAAEQMAAITAADAVYGPNAAFHRACALVGMARYPEAIPFARDALARNTLKDNAAQFAELIARAEQARPFDAVALTSDTPDRRASRRLERGEFAEVASLERSASNWKLARVVLAAARFRFESENEPLVTERHRDVALDVLAKSAGQTGIDAALCRVEALFAREQALFPIEPPCPLGTRIPREEFGRIFEQRSGRGGSAKTAASAAAASAAESGVADPVIFAGQKLPRLSDYARVMKGMQSGNVVAALAAEGLDMASYGQLAGAWGKRLAEDPVLAAKLQKLMTS